MFEITMLNKLGLFNQEIGLKDLVLNNANKIIPEQYGVISHPSSKKDEITSFKMFGIMEKVDVILGVYVFAQILPPGCQGTAKITYFNKQEYLIITLYQSNEVSFNYKNFSNPNSYFSAHPCTTMHFSSLLISTLESMGVKDVSKGIEVLKLSD